VEYRVLGPLEVVEAGRRLPLGGGRQRAVLAVLLLHRRQVVSLDRLVESLWGDEPPLTAAKTIQVYVSRLRKLLGAQTLETWGRGYRLAIDPGSCDLDRFEALVARARTAAAGGDPVGADALFGEALALWRGPALDEFAADPFADHEIAPLAEARIAAREDQIDAQLDAGRGPDLVPELESLTRAHPSRERLAAALMLALYRAGRQTDALAVYRATRERLVDELGLEPSPVLRDLERRILQHDPTLRRTANVLPGRRRTRATRRLAAVIAGLVVIAGGAALFAAQRPRDAHATLQGGPGVVAINTSTGQPAAATHLAGSVAGVGDGAGSVWVASPGTSSVIRVDPNSATAVDRIPLGSEPGAIVEGGGSLWVAATVGPTLTRIDPATERVTQTIRPAGTNLNALAYGAGALWAADQEARKLFEIDPVSGQVRRAISLDVRPSAVLVADGAVWVTGYDSATIERLDPGSGRIAGHVRIGDGPVSLAFGDHSLWAADGLDATVSRVDPRRMRVAATIPVGGEPTAVLAHDGSIWVADGRNGTVSRLDPRHDRITSTARVGGDPTSLAFSGARLWAGVGAAAGSHHGGTLVLVTTQRFGSLDPAVYDVAAPPQFIGLSYDTLLTFEHSGSSGGVRLVPDLALSIPRPIDHDTAYRFHLRPGIRYADGRLVRAGDFRRGIERLFALHSPGSPFFSGLVGAAGCQAHPDQCHLTHGVVTDDRAGTVRFNLTAPDPDFLDKLTEQAYSAPVPAGSGIGTRPPGTGPYRVAAVSAHEIRLVRNPWFREWSPAAQPQGNPDAIAWRVVPSAHAAVQQVVSGRADWFLGLIPAADHRRLALQAPRLLHSSPLFAVDFVPLNTHRPPFDDVRVRRALNFAIDRRAIVRFYGGARFASPTCQPLAPGLPGYQRYCPYTRHRASTGAWDGPDLARARRLVAASGTRGERVAVWGSTDESYIPAAVPRYITRVLRSLGYRARLHLTSFASIHEAARRRFQLSVDGDWLADYPAPSAYLPQFFGCGGGLSNGYYCNPSLDDRMREALHAQARDPADADRTWTGIDHQITDDAAWVPTVNEREVEVVSPRLRNYQFNPVWGFLADQSWVR
jgi:ABC-type transport system substrate-binding protein/DNA-binding SARP family transcriptional activator/streptogramin lyase